MDQRLIAGLNIYAMTLFGWHRSANRHLSLAEFF
jgi:hypothetical protein